MRRGFLFWGARLEHWLLRSVVLCAVLLIAVQWFSEDPVVSAISKSGIDINDETSVQSASNLDHLVTIQLLDYSTLPMASVLVNGKKVANFEERFIAVPVTDGDTLEIDTKFYQRPISFKILDTYGGIKWPKVNDTFIVDGTMKKLGTVIVEESRKDGL